MPSPLMQTLSEARSRWLSGDDRAWAEYVACCLRLEAEHRRNQAADRRSEPREAAPQRPSRDRQE